MNGQMNYQEDRCRIRIVLVLFHIKTFLDVNSKGGDLIHWRTCQHKTSQVSFLVQHYLLEEVQKRGLKLFHFFSFQTNKERCEKREA